MLDVLITGGAVYDGSGGPPVRADGGIAGDRVARIAQRGAAGPGEAALVIDAAGKAVCPGFINIPAATAASPACSATTRGMSRYSRWPRPSTG